MGISALGALACPLVLCALLPASGETVGRPLDALLRWQDSAIVGESCRLGVSLDPDHGVEAILKESKRWRLRLFAGVGVDKALTDVLSGDLDFVDDGFVLGVELGRVLWEDIRGWPLDISANVGLMLHPETSSQDRNIYHFTGFLKAEWKSFPWDAHLRTRLGVGEGLSYVTHITYSEMVRRDFRPSKHLLNYLDISLSFHMGDLVEVTRLHHLLPFIDPATLSDAWLVAAVKHRSGASGVFGSYEDENGDKQVVTGGDNLFTLGLELQF